jgi:hypothetical protein
MAGVIWALGRNKTQWEEELFFTLRLARQKLFKHYAEVTPSPSNLLISAHILNSIRKMRSFRTWDNEKDINPEYETSYTTQYEECFLKYVENE